MTALAVVLLLLISPFGGTDSLLPLVCTAAHTDPFSPVRNPGAARTGVATLAIPIVVATKIVGNVYFFMKVPLTLPTVEMK